MTNIQCHCPNLKRLDLGRLWNTPGSDMYRSSSRSERHRINVSRASQPPTALGPEQENLIRCLIQSCRKLEVLTLGQYFKDVKLLLAILCDTMLPQLKHLDLFHQRGKHDDVRPYTMYTMKRFLESLPQRLEFLRIGTSSYLPLTMQDDRHLPWPGPSRPETYLESSTQTSLASSLSSSSSSITTPATSAAESLPHPRLESLLIDEQYFYTLGEGSKREQVFVDFLASCPQSGSNHTTTASTTTSAKTAMKAIDTTGNGNTERYEKTTAIDFTHLNLRSLAWLRTNIHQKVEPESVDPRWFLSSNRPHNPDPGHSTMTLDKILSQEQSNYYTVIDLVNFPTNSIGFGITQAILKHRETLQKLVLNTTDEMLTGRDLHLLMCQLTQLRVMNSAGSSFSPYLGPAEAPIIDAEDIIKSSEKNEWWGCQDLQVLKMEIVGIPRPNISGIPGKLMENSKKGEKRSMFSGTTEESFAIQRRVYRQLGRLRNLQVLQLWNGDRLRRKPMGRVYTSVSQYRYDDGDDEDFTWMTCLEMTLESGLDLLATLTELRELDVTNMAHRIGVPELEWMQANWPKLEKVNGLLLDQIENLYPGPGREVKDWLIENEPFWWAGT
ncbi:hypothetical protein BG004_005971 [Podila humilis]|nr:hypothetical protein BG004_005971 [Podila humilis]